jgi:hypothetical protein
MIDLTEMEQRVLSELEEFWEENVFAMLNTIIEPAGDAREVALLQQALRGLVERDYVVMGLQGFSPREQEKLERRTSLDLISDLGNWFRFDFGRCRLDIEQGRHKKGAHSRDLFDRRGTAKGNRDLGAARLPVVATEKIVDQVPQGGGATSNVGVI